MPAALFPTSDAVAGLATPTEYVDAVRDGYRQRAADHIQAKLGEIVAGNAPGRRSDGVITAFDSGGTGIETVAAASLLSERAREKGLG